MEADGGNYSSADLAADNAYAYPGEELEGGTLYSTDPTLGYLDEGEEASMSHFAYGGQVDFEYVVVACLVCDESLWFCSDDDEDSSETWPAESEGTVISGMNSIYFSSYLIFHLFCIELIHPEAARDWNAEFQQVVEMPESLERYRRLAVLAEEFRLTARHFAELVVNEMATPVHLKTVKPLNVGGIAGGEKFSIRG